MSNDTKPNSNRTDDKQPAQSEQSAQPGQQTWEGGRREPIHPDDRGADGEYLGSGEQKQQGEAKPATQKGAGQR
jgi:hypothetical protein